MSTAPRATLGDYLDDEEGPFWAMWPHLVDAVYRDGPRDENLGYLSEPARHLYLVGVLRGEVLSGGLSTYFSNTSGNHVEETFEALKALGAETIHGILERALAPFDGAMPPRDQVARCDQLFAFEEREPELLDAIEAEMQQHEAALGELQTRYIEEHAEAPLLSAR